MELSLLQVVAAMGVVGLGAIVQGTIGFGMAVVAAPFLYQIDPALVPGPLIFSGMALGALSARRYASEIDVAILGYSLLGRVPGSMIGVLILTLVSIQHLSLVLGGTVLLAVVGSILPYQLKMTPFTLFSAGLCSGVMGTSASIGGPPMALLLQNESGNRIRANLSVFFVVGSGISLIMLAVNDLLSKEQLIYGVCLFPAVLTGHWIAGKVVEKVEKERFRQIMLVICSLSGITAILSAV
ncbi:sulfite exporter TauE/SafE family protein [Endozoicomonas sp. SCSIO W0465]|uniref:sulfite exporter TauE/SafE family protein n=1 Tax=Endozoicomonas sp. SCSIO W0465 TaxID=2918516 RepID=UPI0020760888|nr:sulfite exporter TauE/SafE family protein [Endozoicomonas sp. SCSIO W0465]USE34244.1 sulfite exporter TauE/SafE family protein [Endozoicomonas sp. SCSIO W0465]